jgi:nucleoside-diphosphate-sugar epimerase
MRILVAGASGVAGRSLIPALVARGHSVAGLVRKEQSAALVARMGARPFVADALDAARVEQCLDDFRPEAVTHQMTAIPRAADLRDFERAFAATNELRTRGLDVLLAAARRVGARRFVAQSFCAWSYARTGGPVKSEDDPPDDSPPRAIRTTVEALRHLESAMLAATDVQGVALRYGGFYGPGTFLAADGEFVGKVRRRRAPVVGHGGGTWSFLHVDDLATATAAALESDVPGIFNVVDDEPAPVAEWLPGLARILGAPPPRRVPGFVGRLVLPAHLYLMMTAIRGGSNARFKRTFGWKPKFPSWNEGFGSGL